MLAKEIIEIMERHFPLSLQEEWDKCGLQIGDIHQEVQSVMISLNADLQTIDEAIEKGCQMLITHHPFLLDPIININNDDIMGKFIFKAIQNNVVVYSAHTSLDNAKMNRWLIEKLGVNDMQVADETGIIQKAKLNKPMTQSEFIDHVQKVYHLEHFKYAGVVNTVETVAVCGGSGASMMEELYGQVDAYITGDTKYHQAKNAIDHDILLIDVNHHVENIMVSKLKELLEKEVKIEIIEGSSPDYYQYR